MSQTQHISWTLDPTVPAAAVSLANFKREYFSSVTLFAATCGFSVFFFVNLLSPELSTGNQTVYTAGSIILLLGVILPGWMIIFCHVHSYIVTTVSMVWFKDRFFPTLHHSIVLCTPIGFGLCLLSTLLHPKCYSQSLLGAVFNCHLSDVSPSISLNYVIIVMICPLTLQHSPCCMSKKITALSWLISFVMIVAVSLMSRSHDGDLLPLYSCCVGLTMYNAERILTLSILRTLFSSESCSLNPEDQALVAQMNLLKVVITNFTHDLLTPIQALEMGVDTMYGLTSTMPTSVSRIQSKNFHSIIQLNRIVISHDAHSPCLLVGQKKNLLTCLGACEELSTGCQ